MFVYSGRGILRRDAVWFILKSVSGCGMELIK